MTETTPKTQEPMPGSELFIHNVDSAPAYWWLDDLWIVLAEAKDTGGRFSTVWHGHVARPRSTASCALAMQVRLSL